MFVNAIEEVSKFTRPIHTITRNYKETIVRPGAATLFFVNENGYAITCKHVIDLIRNRQAVNDHYANFNKEKLALGKNKYIQKLRELESKYNLKTTKDKPITIQIQELFIGCTSENSINYRWIDHPKYDLSILIFENFKNPMYQSYARFVKDSSLLKQGKFLCRLGYPFPEFTNFKYNQNIDDIEWTNEGQNGTPRFPIEGMLTRNLINGDETYGVELSTPGLRGQSGGPLFDQNGLIYGMQSQTNALHLGFDMKNFEYKSNGDTIKVNNQPFLHVGHCIHVDIIKDFLKSNGVSYYEE
ncbi:MULTISPECIES: trypsin-like peptidase domain-containing protein [Flavobacterium]|uniref:Serine protease n=2 Tax=Flavobacterium TaxID=237 RepID=A0A4R5CGY6_9FLAO|nr:MULTISPECIES: trypsin-like peptidase domain-containing protein [Flavobacterium]TDD99381.1 serine protease [Flavobacterium cellulosilyticum]TRX01360.1 trypsin-like peptidase domain-containing protein [Flavobacterium gawalongense]TRX05884.1 trypsin-like peptidase domain-containing protein [Flavobacterium gawalongense]